MHLSGRQVALPFFGATGAARGTYTLSHNTSLFLLTDYFLPPLRRPRPATVFLVPLRVREFVRVR